MGVGVFSDDFSETGGTFIVRQDLDDPSDGEFDFDNITEIIASAGKELNLEVTPTVKGQRNNASFDSNFCAILEDSSGAFSVGIRGWEHDYIVGVGASKENSRMQDTWQSVLSQPDEEDNAIDLILLSGMSPKLISEKYHAAVTAVGEYIRIALLESCYECSYKTSGYTTGNYELPPKEEIDAIKIGLKEKVNAWQELSFFNPLENLLKASKDDRLQIIKWIDKAYHPNLGLQVEVPIYDQNENCFLSMNACSKEIVGASICNFDVSKLSTPLVLENGRAFFPRNEETEGWFQERQERLNNVSQRTSTIRVIASSQEYCAMSCDELELGKDVDMEDIEIEPDPDQKKKLRM